MWVCAPPSRPGRQAVRPRPRPRRRGADLRRERREDASRGLQVAGRDATRGESAAANRRRVICEGFGISRAVGAGLCLGRSQASPWLPCADPPEEGAEMRSKVTISVLSIIFEENSSATNQAGGWRRYLIRKCTCLKGLPDIQRPLGGH